MTLRAARTALLSPDSRTMWRSAKAGAKQQGGQWILELDNFRANLELYISTVGLI